MRKDEIAPLTPVVSVKPLADYVAGVRARYRNADGPSLHRLAACERQLDYHEAVLALDPASAFSEAAYLKLVPIWCRLVGVIGGKGGFGGDEEFMPVRPGR